MGDIKEINVRYEVKIGIIYALVAFLVVFIVGLLNHIEFKIIMKRILISELFFIPMGLMIGYIFKSVIRGKPPQEDESSENNIQNSTDVDTAEKEDKIGKTIHDKMDDKINGKNENEIITEGGSRETPDKDGIDIMENVKDEVDIPNMIVTDNEGNPPEMNVTDEYKGLKEQSTSSLGKHIIVNDKKIINDPKLMAEAVRTMMNKE